MGKQTNQYTKTRTAANSQAQDRMDWDSTEDGGTTFESAQMTRDELILLISDNVDTIYTANSQLTGHRIVDGQTLYDLDFLDIDSFEVNANDISLASVSNTAIGAGGHLDLFATDGVGINLTAPPTAALDIRLETGNALSLYEDRAGGALNGDVFGLDFYFNDSLGTRTLGGAINARVDGAPTTGDVNMSLILNNNLKIQENNRVLITPGVLTKSAVAQFEVRGEAGVTTDPTALFVGGGNASSTDIVLKASNNVGSNLLELTNSGRFWHNVSGLSTADFLMVGGTETYSFFMDAGKDAVGIGEGTINDAAKLHITSTTKGIVQTPMTAAQATAITAVEGLIVFVSDTDATFTAIGFWGYQNAAWTKM